MHFDVLHMILVIFPAQAREHIWNILFGARNLEKFWETVGKAGTD